MNCRATAKSRPAASHRGCPVIALDGLIACRLGYPAFFAVQAGARPDIGFRDRFDDNEAWTRSSINRSIAFAGWREKIAEVYPTDKIKSSVHLSIGQEAVSVGVCEALRPNDVAFGTYRSHALYLAKGGNLKAMIAELYGKVTGAAKGKGGSMHLIDLEAGVLGTSAVVGTTIANAVGYAYGLKCRRQDSIVASFFRRWSR